MYKRRCFSKLSFGKLVTTKKQDNQRMMEKHLRLYVTILRLLGQTKQMNDLRNTLTFVRLVIGLDGRHTYQGDGRKMLMLQSPTFG